MVGRVVEGVGGETIVGGELDRLRYRDVLRIEVELDARSQRRHGAVGEPHLGDHRDLRRAPSQHPHEAVAVGGEARRDHRQLGVYPPQLPTRLQHRQAVEAALRVGRHDAAAGEEGVAGPAERPLRPAELGLHRGQRHRGFVLPAVQVPPAGAVRHEVEAALRAPRRLEDRLGGGAGHQLRFDERRPLSQGRHPQLGAVPGHLGVVPAQPGEAGTGGIEPRRGVEVPSAGQHDGGMRAIAGYGDQLVDHLAVVVAFPHAEQVAAVGGDDGVGVAPRRRQVGLGGDRLRFPAGLLTVEALVGEVGEEHGVPVEYVGAASVLVDPGADVVAGRRDVAHCAVGSAAHEDVASLLGGAALEPVDGTGREGGQAQAQAGLGQVLGGDGRLPGPIGGSLRHGGDLGGGIPRSLGLRASTGY